MKIAIESEVLTFESSGVSKSLIHLINECKKILPKLEVVCFSTKKIKNKFDFPVKKIMYKSNKFGRFLLRQQLSDCDIIHYHWNGRLLDFSPKEKTTAMIHDVLPLIIPNCLKTQADKDHYKNITQYTLDNAKIIFTPSDFSKNEIQKNFEVRNEIVVLPHGVTLPENYLPQKSDDSQSYFIYVGGYDPRKGMVDLLKAFFMGHLQKRLNKKLYFVGKSNSFSEEFEKLVKITTEQGILEEKGYVSEIELANLIHNSCGLIYPSKYEGFGLPPLEAMALGCPVITTNYTSIPNITKDAALYIEPDNTDDFIFKIEQLQNDINLRNDLIEKGYERVKDFSWRKSAENFITSIAKGV